MSRTPPKGTVRPDVVKLLTGYDPTQGRVRPRPAGLVHRDSGKPYTMQENLLAWSATAAERQAAAAIWASRQAVAEAQVRDRQWARDRLEEYGQQPDEPYGRPDAGEDAARDGRPGACHPR